MAQGGHAIQLNKYFGLDYQVGSRVCLPSLDLLSYDWAESLAVLCLVPYLSPGIVVLISGIFSKVADLFPFYRNSCVLRLVNLGPVFLEI